MRKGFIAVAAVLAAAAVFFYCRYTRPVHIIAAGDILLDRGVNKYLEEKGYDYPYESVKKVITEGDIAVANLECPLTDGGSPVFKRPELIFKGSRLNGSALKRAGFDILNLANNHTMDQGSEGLLDTMKVLESSGIRCFGAGANRNEARRPVFIKKGNIRIGFLGYSNFPPEGYIFHEDKADVARPDMKTIGEEVEAAREQCDFLLVSFHWGKEFDDYPSEMQREMAHATIERGADIIIGHHPHVLQSVEEYKGKLIFYSLGNFVFDRQLPEGTDESVIIDITVDRSGWKKARIVPVGIADCRPVILQGEAAVLVLDRLKYSSKDHGAEIDITEGIGYISR
ncbi:MAG: CapA family protein [Clostridiaceae bacterium]|nr:CapA family protein [Clostridiaceae bacterium]